MKTLGFREMHDAQIAELIEFIETSLNVAAMTDSAEIYEEMTEKAQDLIEIFGGIQLVTEISLEI